MHELEKLFFPSFVHATPPAPPGFRSRELGHVGLVQAYFNK